MLVHFEVYVWMRDMKLDIKGDEEEPNLHESVRAGLTAGQRSTLGCGRATFTHLTTLTVSLITRQTLQRAERGQNRTRLI